jgi:hypothetical protein
VSENVHTVSSVETFRRNVSTFVYGHVGVPPASAVPVAQAAAVAVASVVAEEVAVAVAVAVAVGVSVGGVNDPATLVRN